MLEDKSYLQAVYDIIPFSLFQSKIDIDVENKKCSASEIKSPSFKLLEDLLVWFKYSFFTWVQSVPCELCKQKSFKTIIDVPNHEEKIHLAYITEKHYCDNCKHYTRFPRYNCPRKLLSEKRYYF